jgi:hypothetical protein
VLPRLRRAEQHAVGAWVALDPGEGYVEDNPFCTGLARLLGVPTYELLLALLKVDDIVPGVGRGLADLLSGLGFALTVYPGVHGKNREKSTKIKWIAFGSETDLLYATPVDLMDAKFVFSQSIWAAVSDARSASPFLEGEAPAPPAEVLRHRGRPSTVFLRLHDGTGGRTDLGCSDDDAQYALVSLFRKFRVTEGGSTSLRLKCRHLRGGFTDVVLFQKAADRGGKSRWSVGRRVRSTEVFLRAGGWSEAVVVETLRRVCARRKAYKEADAMASESVKNGRVLLFSEAESKHILTLVGTQQAYRELASKLRIKYKTQVLTPIDRIAKSVDRLISKATHGTVDVVEETIHEVKVKGTKTNKTTTKKTIKLNFWLVDHLFDELQLELNAIGRSFVKLRIADLKNVAWLLFGGDGGGKPKSTFKLGVLFLNQDKPLSPLNVRLVGVLRGKDTRPNLTKTVLTPAFAAQVAAVKHSEILHIVSTYKHTEEQEIKISAIHSSLIVPRGVAVLSRKNVTAYVDISDKTSGDLSFKPPDQSVECIGVLAIRDGHVVGVAVLAVQSEFDLDVVMSIAENSFGIHSLDYWCREEPFETITSRSPRKDNLPLFKFDFVAFYAVAEPFPPGTLVFAETLGLRRKLAADHALYSVVFGHQGATSTYLCWACETTKEGAPVACRAAGLFQLLPLRE